MRQKSERVTKGLNLNPHSNMIILRDGDTMLYIEKNQFEF